MYNEKIMEAFKKAESMGEIRQANAIGDAGSAAFGDVLKFYMIVEDEKIIEAKCKAFGSAVTIAIGSVCAQNLPGKTLDEALLMDINEIVKCLGDIPSSKQNLLNIAKEAIAEAVNYYYKKQEKAQKEQID